MKILPLVLFCATAALLHAQPAKPGTVEDSKAVIAEVLGKPIHAEDREQLSALIFTPLLEHYAKEKKIEPTAEEVKTFLAKSDEMAKETREGFAKDKKRLEGELKSAKLSEEDRTRKEQELAMTEDLLKSMADDDEGKEKAKVRDAEETKMARDFVRAWKVNRALFKQYGGRVIFQQAGPEPLDAYRDFLREQEAKGAFCIADEKDKAAFWKYFTDETMHTFLDAKEGAEMMDTPLLETPTGE